MDLRLAALRLRTSLHDLAEFAEGKKIKIKYIKIKKLSSFFFVNQTGKCRLFKKSNITIRFDLRLGPISSTLKSYPNREN